MPLLALVAVVVLLGALLGYIYMGDSNQISTLNSQVSSQSVQISSMEAQHNVDISNITAEKAEISSDTAQIASDINTISSLKTSIANDVQTISSLNGTVKSDTSEISSLQSQIANSNTQVQSLTSQVSSLESQVSSLQSQVSGLQSTINNLRDTNNEISGAMGQTSSQILHQNEAFAVPTGQQESFIIHVYTGGYLLATVVTSTSSDTVVMTNMTSSAKYDVGSSGTVAFYVPANTYLQLNFLDANTRSFSATVDVWFFYS